MTRYVICLVDIVIYISSAEEHELHVRLLLEWLRKFGLLFVKLSNVVLVWTRSISSVLLLAQVSRWKTVESWPEPTCVRDVQILLGFSKFYRRFIEGYSRKTASLSHLTK